MALYEFATSEKILAIRRAVDFWFKTLYGKVAFIKFLSCCEWIKKDGQFKLTFNSDLLPEMTESNND
jgi:hypothetical protein